MLEKYGVDMSELPVTDDQLRELKTLTKGAGFAMPKNRQEAQALIEKLAGDNHVPQ